MEAARPMRDETALERADRNLAELLTGLRVALPGVQVLFAFLLVVPFNQRFADVTPFQEAVYFATLVTTALSSVCLIAPSVHHRLRFRRGEKERIVLIANRLAIVGLSLLAVAMVEVVLLVSDFVFGSSIAAVATTGIAAAFLVVWYVVPVVRRDGGGG